MPHHTYRSPPCKIIAHRGNSAQAPENTLSAFRHAIELSVDFIECDVQLSRDAIPMVTHDKTFERITKNRNRHDVNAMDCAEIQKLDAGSWFDEKFKDERVPTLEQLLQIPMDNVGLMLEVKRETVTECGLAKIVGDVLKKAHLGNQVLIGSLNPDILFCLEAYLPQQQFIPIVDFPNKIKDFEGIPAKHYAIHWTMATRRRIRELQERGCEVWTWTVDDKSVALELMHRGIDGIITNMPKKIMSLHIAPASPT